MFSTNKLSSSRQQQLVFVNLYRWQARRLQLQITFEINWYWYPSRWVYLFILTRNPYIYYKSQFVILCKNKLLTASLSWVWPKPNVPPQSQCSNRARVKSAASICLCIRRVQLPAPPWATALIGVWCVTSHWPTCWSCAPPLLDTEGPHFYQRKCDQWRFQSREWLWRLSKGSGWFERFPDKEGPVHWSEDQI